MSEIPDDRGYTADHEWVLVQDDGTYRVGVTDHAQHELNDLVYIELPAVGDSFARGEPMAVAESVKAASDIFAPFDAEVVEVNAQLEESPELVNESPYELGWMAVLRPAGELPELLDAAGYGVLVG